MEQITLTKEELKEIIAKEVRNAIKGEKPISSGAIFSKVRINNDDLEGESEYNLAAKVYREIKNYYLYIYEKRVSELTIDDFE
ncbi:hypothetical protein L1A00_00005 [Staphylococcus aureus]|uniref:hypothetical protein n=1 Tax=Staphylococcus aureus TaxID=1280 RepID=UPI001F1FDAF5|nr:hypothetical protein [Staphylococcus aureus]UIZ36519.1 hypothetical protein L1A00_00005 [Staphylococcus aureus]